MNRSARLAVLLVSSSVMVASLVACVPSRPMPVPTYTPSSSATAAPDQDPVLRPGEGAAENKAFFDQVADQFLFDHGMGDGRAAIDNLVAAGFRKEDMQVTPDTTALGIAVDSLIFSVRIKDECLIGQYSAMGYTSIIAPILGTGTCLVGVTRPIDW